MALDKNLDQPSELWIIGGSAAALGYGVQTATKDIDILPRKHSLTNAIKAAREATGLNIPVQEVGIYEAPQNFEDRAKEIPIEGLKHLVVKVPEKHDLVLMKMIRGEDPDLAVAEEISRLHGLDKDILIGRYLDEMDAAIGQRSMLDLSCEALISRVFGDVAAKEASERIKARRSRDKRG